MDRQQIQTGPFYQRIMMVLRVYYHYESSAAIGLKAGNIIILMA